MTIKEDFYARVCAKLGDTATVTDVLDYLWDTSVIDGVQARKYCIRQAFCSDFGQTHESARVVMGDVGERYGVTREYVLSLVNEANVSW